MKTLLLWKWSWVVLENRKRQKMTSTFLHLTFNSFGLDVVCPPVLCMEAGALDLAQPKLDCCSRFYSIGRASVPLKHRIARRLCTTRLHRNLCRFTHCDLELEHQHLKAEKAIRTWNPTSTVIVTCYCYCYLISWAMCWKPWNWTTGQNCLDFFISHSPQTKCALDMT